MRQERFFDIKLLEKRVVGRATYLFRYEIPEKGLPYYCVRDSKFKKIIVASNRALLDEYWSTYLELKKNPVNPFRADTIIYEESNSRKREYRCYQVIEVKKQKICIRAIKIERVTDSIRFDRIVPQRNQFASSDVIEKKIRIIQVNGNRPAYGIQSETGTWRSLVGDSIYVLRAGKART